MICRPFGCPFPKPGTYPAGTRWICEGCGTAYRLTRPRRRHWWRNWDAPNGYWRLAKLPLRLFPH